MNRRKFTYLSGLALPASFLPLSKTLRKLANSPLQPAIQDQLQAFKMELMLGLSAHPTMKTLAKQMTSPRHIHSINYQDEQEYMLIYESLSGNTVQLECKKGVKRILVS